MALHYLPDPNFGSIERDLQQHDVPAAEPAKPVERMCAFVHVAPRSGHYEQPRRYAAVA